MAVGFVIVALLSVKWVVELIRTGAFSEDGPLDALQEFCNFLALVVIFEWLRRRRRIIKSRSIAVFPYRALSHTANDVVRKLVAFVNQQDLADLGVIEEDTERWRAIRSKLARYPRPASVDGEGWWNRFMEAHNMATQTRVLCRFLKEDEALVSDLFAVVTRLRREINNAFGTWAIYTELSEDLDGYLELYRSLARLVEELQQSLRELRRLRANGPVKESEFSMHVHEAINRFWLAATLSLVIAHKFATLAEYETSQIEGLSSNPSERSKKMTANRHDVEAALLWAWVFASQTYGQNLRDEGDPRFPASDQLPSTQVRGVSFVENFAGGGYFTELEFRVQFDESFADGGVDLSKAIRMAQSVFLGDPRWLSKFGTHHPWR